MNLVWKVTVAAIFDSKMAAVENLYIFLNISKTQTAREFILVARPPLARSVSHFHYVWKVIMAAILDFKMAAIRNIYLSRYLEHLKS